MDNIVNCMDNTYSGTHVQRETECYISLQWQKNCNYEIGNIAHWRVFVQLGKLERYL